MMRSTIIIAFALLASALPAHAQCWAVTHSGKAELRKLLTPAELCAARAEAKRRGCSEASVPEGTFGAISAGGARTMLPLIRRMIPAEPACAVAARKVKPMIETRRPPAARKMKEKAKVAPPPPEAAAERDERPAAPPMEPIVIFMPPPPAPAPAVVVPSEPTSKPRGFLTWLRSLIW